MERTNGPVPTGEPPAGVFDLAGAALAIADASGRIGWANAAFRALHRVPVDGGPELSLRDLVVGRPGTPSPLPEPLTLGFQGVVRHRRLDGTLFFGELTVRPAGSGVSIAVRDASEERRAAAVHDCLLALLRTARENPSPGELFPVAHALVCRLLPATGFAVVGLDPETSRVELLYSAPEKLGEDVRDAVWSVAGEVIAARAPLCLGPVSRDGEKRSRRPGPAGVPGTSWVGAPLGDALGALVVWASGGAGHDEADGALLGTLAPLVGEALRRGREEARRQGELRAKTALMEALSDAGQALVTLRDGFVVSANDAALRLAETTPEELLGRRLLLELAPLAERTHLARLLASPPREPFETALALPGGERREVQMAIRAVDLPDGRLHLAVFHDVTTLVRSARTDWLTSLPNRRSTEEVLAREWERLRRRSGAFALSRGELTDARPVTPLSVVMIDIDDFSLFNDRHGHHTGDEMLRRTALVLRSALRSCDIVGRWGGEEFLAILPETDDVGAVAVAERLRHAVEADAFYDLPRFASGEDGASEAVRLKVTISLGVATEARPAAATPHGLVRRADAALYAAKAAGKNRVVPAPPEADSAG